MAQLLTSIVSYVLGVVYIAALGIAHFSLNPWVYHPIFFLLLLLPSLLAFVFAIKGRQTNPSTRIDRTFNAIGTSGCLTVGVLLLTCYVWAVISK
jgi:membrane protein implicated in regulation of membrane protease activity